MTAKRSTRHPLLTEVIDELPKRDDGFTAAQRQAWIDRMLLAFRFVYGEVDPLVAAPSIVPDAAPPAKADQPHPFHVDAEGFARGPHGREISPVEVPKTETLWDMRPAGLAGDMSTVIWLDGIYPPNLLTQMGLAITLEVPAK